jgi:hypothetical protein
MLNNQSRAKHTSTGCGGNGSATILRQSIASMADVDRWMGRVVALWDALAGLSLAALGGVLHPGPAHAVSDSLEAPTRRLDSLGTRGAGNAANAWRSLQSRARGMSVSSSIWPTQHPVGRRAVRQELIGRAAEFFTRAPLCSWPDDGVVRGLGCCAQLHCSRRTVDQGSHERS